MDESEKRMALDYENGTIVAVKDVILGKTTLEVIPPIPLGHLIYLQVHFKINIQSSQSIHKLVSLPDAERAGGERDGIQ